MQIVIQNFTLRWLALSTECLNVCDKQMNTGKFIQRTGILR